MGISARGLAIALVVAACGPKAAPNGPHAAEKGAWVSMSLPALEGGEIDLTSYRGKIVVMHFFTTWSIASQVDVAELEKTRDALPKDAIVLIGVGMDPDGYKLIEPWREAAGVDYLVVLATPELLGGESAFGDLMQVVPDTFVIDAAGRIAWERRGPLVKGELSKVVRNLEAHAPNP